MIITEIAERVLESAIKATPVPWVWEADDASMLTLGGAGSDGGVDQEKFVLAAARCRACQKRDDARCFWPSKENGDYLLAAANNAKVLAQAVIDQHRQIQQLR